MRRWLWIGAVLMSGAAFAQEASDAVFVPPENGGYGKVLDMETGKESAVLGTFSMPPADCPPDSYWIHSGVNLVSCDDGKRFLFQRFDYTNTVLPAGTLGLKPIPPDDDKTYEPGPRIEESDQ